MHTVNAQYMCGFLSSLSLLSDTLDSINQI